MHHVAIMKKSWKLIPKIISGEKTAESRWYKFKHLPWDRIHPGDTIWFKDSGEPVTVCAKVTRVSQFHDLTLQKTKEILVKYGRNDLGVDMAGKLPRGLSDYFRNKSHAIFVFFKDVQCVKPFNIDKTGFGVMSAWITVPDIETIKLA